MKFLGKHLQRISDLRDFYILGLKLVKSSKGYDEKIKLLDTLNQLKKELTKPK